MGEKKENENGPGMCQQDVEKCVGVHPLVVIIPQFHPSSGIMRWSHHPDDVGRQQGGNHWIRLKEEPSHWPVLLLMNEEEKRLRANRKFLRLS
ncbi:hypothetical protein CDAR_515991 [Caerostris darwini]|uniref:Uncharacterized protein n=1 Tax=Caerostris darwini TaxID=1538125 RepID=A0AAV4NGX0_9ARAC|nr:hypothetical protein CDAR_515991 [Caerostris darwini]